MHALAPVVLILLLAVLVITGCRRFHVTPLLGYLVIGFVAGPAVASWMPEGEEIAFLGEIGIVFLMFTIGLEFSLSKLKAMQQLVFGVGMLQVLLTLLLIGAVVTWLTGSPFAGLALGGALAMSSTAIVSRLLTEQRELGLPHGQLAIGVLLFQDIAVVPLLILLPAFAAHDGHLGRDLAMAGVKIVLVLTVLLVVGQRLIRPWFHLVAKQRSNELFMLNVLLVTLGIAYLTELSGLSLALGAFVAGMLISETEYRYQVEDDIRPFRDLLLGFFFMTVGMRLSLPVLFDHFSLVLLLLVLLLPLKLGAVWLAARLFRHKSVDAMRGALVLAHGGEFGFVLLALADKLQLIETPLLQASVVAIVLSMLLAPFLIVHSEKLARRLTRQDWMMQALDLHHLLVESMSKNDHVLICGYGRSGQSLARLLTAESVPFFALDMDPNRVHEAAEAGDPVVFGDAGKTEVLVAAGIHRARVMVISFADTAAACHILHRVQTIRPDLPVIVRTRDDSDIDKLRAAGADEVVPEMLEGSLMLASQALMESGVSLPRILRRIRTVREERYGLFRGFFHGMDDVGNLDEEQVSRLQSVLLCEGAAAIGQSLQSLKLHEDMSVDIQSVRGHDRRRHFAPAGDFVLSEGDVLVLLGNAEQLARAEARILEG